MDTSRRIDQAKITLMRHDKNTTFFTSMLTHLNIQESDFNDTAWTDGVNIGLCPAFVDQIDTHELIWVLMHELGHIIYEHIPIAMEHGLNMEKHNIAGDHYINWWLKGLGYKEPQPPVIQVHRDPKYKDQAIWSTMKIYNDLPDSASPKGGMGNDIRTPKPADEVAHREKMTQIVMKAVITADQLNDPGSVPMGVRRFVEGMTSPQKPWQDILQQHMTDFANGDYSMSRPNRRYMQAGLYLPTMRSPSLGHMIISTDTSISMEDWMLAEINEESRYIWDTLKPRSCRHISFDTKLHTNHVYETGDYMDDLNLSGGGGTNVLPVIDYIREEDPVLSLIFTDGYFRMPDLDDLPGALFWCIYDNPTFNPPRGEVIHMT